MTAQNRAECVQQGRASRQTGRTGKADRCELQNKHGSPRGRVLLGGASGDDDGDADDPGHGQWSGGMQLHPGPPPATLLLLRRG